MSNSPDHLFKDVNPNDELLKQITSKEAECLDRILTRFCILNGLPINVSRVEWQEFQGRDNYYELFYIGPIRKASGIKHFLMSRELKVIDNVPTLDIKFNPDLLKED